MADARAVANYFIELAQNDTGRELTPMQLLKLTYIAHGYSLAFRSVELIDNEIQAWQFGPVIPDLYHKIKQYRDSGVKSKIPRYNSDELDGDEMGLVDAVYEAYGHRTGVDLSNLTHQPGSPWSLVYQPQTMGIKISNDLIEGHYRKLAGVDS